MLMRLFGVFSYMFYLSIAFVSDVFSVGKIKRDTNETTVEILYH